MLGRREGRSVTPSGFTLIEMLIVIAVIGVLAGIAIVAFQPFEDAAEAACAQANERIEAGASAASAASSVLGEDLTEAEFIAGLESGDDLGELSDCEFTSAASAPPDGSTPPGAWDATTASFDGVAFDTSGQTSNTRSLHFRPDGTAFYIVGRASNNVVQYQLSTPWQVDTAALVGAYDTSGQGSVTHGVYLRSDGAVMYVWNRFEVRQYSLSTPWDVTTASQTGFAGGLGVTRGHDIDFRPDGSVLYVEDRVDEVVRAYALSTPWDIATWSLLATYDISGRHDQVRGIQFRPDGRQMLLLDTGLREVQQHRLATPWDISSATFESAYDVGDQFGNPRGLAVGRDGTKMYVVDASSGVVFQYSLGSG